MTEDLGSHSKGERLHRDVESLSYCRNTTRRITGKYGGPESSTHGTEIKHAKTQMCYKFRKQL